MALQQIPGNGMYVPREWESMAITTFTTSAIAATGDKFAISGRVVFKERTGTKNIQTVGFRFGAVTKAGGSALTVSLQDVSLTAGPTMQPDGTQDQTVAVANGNAAFVANTWLQTGNLSATRTVNYGDLLSIVIEYDGSGRLGSDTFAISSMTAAGTSYNRLQSVAATQISSSWAFAGSPDVVLGFDDGTFGTLSGGYPASAFASHTYNSGTAGADEYAIGLQFPFPVKISGALLPITVNSGADFSVILYSGTTALQTVPMDSNCIAIAASSRFLWVPIPETQLAANTLYYLAIRPDTTNSVIIFTYDVASANHLQATGGGTAFVEYSRLDSGAWGAAVTTRRPMIAVEVSACDDGASIFVESHNVVLADRWGSMGY